MRTGATESGVEAGGNGYRPDKNIARAVRRLLEQGLRDISTHISFTVSAAWVTLEGHVAQWQNRVAVEQAILNLAGVLGIANQLEVKHFPLMQVRVA
jgi:osmotically-inducible protein OsmY